MPFGVQAEGHFNNQPKETDMNAKEQEIANIIIEAENLTSQLNQGDAEQTARFVQLAPPVITIMRDLLQERVTTQQHIIRATADAVFEYVQGFGSLPVHGQSEGENEKIRRGINAILSEKLIA